MKLFGVGTDIIQVNRLKKPLKKNYFYQEYITRKKLLSVKGLKKI